LSNQGQPNPQPGHQPNPKPHWKPQFQQRRWKPPPKPNLVEVLKPPNPFQPGEFRIVRFLTGERVAVRDDAKIEAFDRNIDFPEKELVKEPRMLDSARDGGTTFRAIGAFSQML